MMSFFLVEHVVVFSPVESKVFTYYVVSVSTLVLDSVYEAESKIIYSVKDQY